MSTTFISTSICDLSTPSMGYAKPNNTKRCNADTCNKKLLLTDFDCKCGARFCSLHRLPEAHCCTFNHKDLQLKNLQKQLVRVIGDKVDKI